MELIYMWTRGYTPFKEPTSFQFTGKFIINLELDEEAKKIGISVDENLDFPNAFFGKSCVNISAIVGKNGTGKTLSLQLLTEILGINPHWYSIKPYLALFFDAATNQIYLDHNLFNVESSQFGQPRQGESQFKIEISTKGNLSYSKKWPKLKAQVIYYSPIINFHDFMIHSREEYVDISTDFLLRFDSSLVKGSNGNIEAHKFKNVERQLNFYFAFQDNKALTGRFSMPEKIEIKSLESGYEKQWRHNLSTSAQSVREYFLGGKDGEKRRFLFDEIYKLNSVLTRLEKTNKTKTREYKMTQLRRVGLFFLLDLIEHFFLVRNGQNHWLEHEIGVKVEDLQGKIPWEAARLFFEKQQWKRKTDQQEALAYLDTLEKIFQDEKTETELHADRKIRIADKSAAHDLLQAHYKYQMSLVTYNGRGSIADHITIDWRNMSAGEEAFLNLFSRLYDAKQIIDERDLDANRRKVENTQWIYLLIDEGELGFHPEWQKDFIKLLLDITPSIFKGQKVQLILTSHSPFVLSDLPKSNVIFLRKNADGFSYVDKGVELENTFAANIHTLLADGFFLENSLLGSFAQKKIGNAIIHITQHLETQKRKIIQLIKLIGEPVIRHKMEQFFFEKFGHNVEDNDLNARIERLKKELTEAEQLKNKEK